MRPQDAPVLAELMNHAGDGLPLHLWSRMAVLGESAWDVGRRVAPRPKAASPVATPPIINHRGESPAV